MCFGYSYPFFGKYVESESESQKNSLDLAVRKEYTA
jgi:hypothetical protein